MAAVALEGVASGNFVEVAERGSSLLRRGGSRDERWSAVVSLERSVSRSRSLPLRSSGAVGNALCEALCDCEEGFILSSAVSWIWVLLRRALAPLISIPLVPFVWALVEDVDMARGPLGILISGFSVSWGAEGRGS